MIKSVEHKGTTYSVVFRHLEHLGATTKSFLSVAGDKPPSDPVKGAAYRRVLKRLKRLERPIETTLCLIKARSGGDVTYQVAVGHAQKHPSDAPNRNEARDRSMHRALKDLATAGLTEVCPLIHAAYAARRKAK